MPNNPLDDLLARAEQEPTDDALRGVLIDALVEAGDPRGELAAVQAKCAALDVLYEELVEKHRKLYVADQDAFRLTKDSGFVDEISLSIYEDVYKKKRAGKPILEKIFATRSGRMATAVKLAFSDKKPAAPVKDMLACLALLPKAPALRSLDLHVGASKGKVAIDVAPALAKLTLTKLGLRGAGALFKSVLAGTWPSVTSLVLEPYRGELAIADCKRLFEKEAFPDLVELSFDGDEEVLEKLVTSPIASQLRVLDLESCSIEDPCGKQLVAAKPTLGKLEKLSVRAKYLTVPTIRELRAAYGDVRGLPDDTQLAWIEGELERSNSRHDHYEEIEE